MKRHLDHKKYNRFNAIMVFKKVLKDRGAISG
jgi:hypothetical protein